MFSTKGPPPGSAFDIVTTLHGWTSTGGLTKMSIYESLDAFCLRRVDQVVFVNDLMAGHVDQVGAYLERCQLFVMPSLTEGLPMELLEAMHAGLPIIASRVGGIPDVLLQGRAGSLIAPDDQQQVTEQICRHYREPQLFAEAVKV